MKSRNGVFVPLLLVALGVVFLLRNLGVFPGDLGAVLAKFWPVILIALGLDMMLDRPQGRWLGFALFVALAAVFWGLLWSLPAAWSATRDLGLPLDSHVQGGVYLAMTRGMLKVHSRVGPGLLAQGTAHAAWPDELFTRVSSHQGTAQLAVNFARKFWAFPWSASSLDLGLSPFVPLALWADVGSGSAELDLVGLKVTRVEVQVRGGKAAMDLSARGEVQVVLALSGGEVRVRFPSQVGLRVEVGGAVEVTGLWEGPGYGEDRLEVVIRGSGGRVQFEKLPTL